MFVLVLNLVYLIVYISLVYVTPGMDVFDKVSFLLLLAFGLAVPILINASSGLSDKQPKKRDRILLKMYSFIGLPVLMILLNFNFISASIYEDDCKLSESMLETRDYNSFNRHYSKCLETNFNSQFFRRALVKYYVYLKTGGERFKELELTFDKAMREVQPGTETTLVITMAKLKNYNGNFSESINLLKRERSALIKIHGDLSKISSSLDKVVSALKKSNNQSEILSLRRVFNKMINLDLYLAKCFELIGEFDKSCELYNDLFLFEDSNKIVIKKHKECWGNQRSLIQ